MTTVVLAEDHTIVRQGLKALLETEPDLEVVDETGDGLEAVRMVERVHPDVLVLDLALPGLNGLEVVRQVRQRVSSTQIVVLSMYGSEDLVVEALHHGAAAYVLKESSADDLVEAVYKAREGKRFFSATIPAELVEVYEKSDPDKIKDRYELLTSREEEVLHLVAEGYTSPEIAEKLFISPRTVESHRSNVLAKLGLRNSVEMVHYVVQRGLLPLGSRVKSIPSDRHVS